MWTMSTKHRRGFTLIELLVVISIIALLIAILLPVLGKARDTARISQCLANQKQMATASTAFATDDKKGRLIPARRDTGGSPNGNPPVYSHTQHAVNVGQKSIAGQFTPGGREFAEYGYPFEIWGDPGRDDFKPFYDFVKGGGLRFDGIPDEADLISQSHLVHGYQYFGGITHWLAVAGNPGAHKGLSPITLDDMTSEKTLVADVAYKHPGTNWGDFSTTDERTAIAFGGSPAHGTRGGEGANANPKGGNHVFSDGSGAWIDFSQMRNLHSWSGGRPFWYFQEDLGDLSF